MTKLEKMLKYVSEHNEFYKSRIKEYGITNPLDINQWPILTRKELQENRYNMFSDGYKSKYFNQQLRRQSSSGSSGMPVYVYWDLNNYYASIRLLWEKRLSSYGIHPFERYVSFGLNVVNTNGNKPIYYKRNGNMLNINISYIHQNDEYERLIEIINEFKPKWLFIRPFILQTIIYHYQRLEIYPPSSISYIESIGEILSLDLKQKAIAFFNVPIVNTYGSEEMNGIAYECSCYNMHILDNNVYLECLNDSGVHDNGEGEAIITNLVNKAMPLIRYNQGDEIILKKSDYCLCGNTAPSISLIKGRTFEVIKTKLGKDINSIMLLSVMANINNRLNNIILNYRFIYQKKTQNLLCFIGLDKRCSNWFNSVKKIIEEDFYKLLLTVNEITFEVCLEYDIAPYNKKYRVLEIVE